MKSKYAVVVVGSIFMASLNAQADGGGMPGSNEAAAPAESAHRVAAEGWRLFGGFGLGYGSVAGAEFASAPRGAQYLFKAALDHRGTDWISELGLGWSYESLNGENQQSLPLRMRTRSGVGEASLRYRFGERWQLGPLVGMNFGADTSEAPSVGASSTAFYGGLRSAYELPGNHPVRFWQQVTTDLSLAQRRHLVAMVGMEIGLPFGRKTASEPAPERGLVSTMGETRTQEIRLVLDSQKVFFNTNSARVRGEINSALQEAGDFLKDTPDNWSSVTISGHADRRGRFAYNQRLSMARAASVLGALKGAVKQDERWKLEAHSFTVPVDTGKSPQALARNRRVELVISGVKDPSMLIEKLKPLMSAQPEVDS